jgi:hypothetical protein
LLRPQALRALEGSDVIIHAGDVGDPEILQKLKTLAPVFAVRGNVDTDPWALALPETEVIETDLATIYVLHDVHSLGLDPVAAGFHLIASGLRTNLHARITAASSFSIPEAPGRAVSTCR